MVQLNLRKELYDESVRRGIKDPNEWISNLAEKDLFPDRVIKQSKKQERPKIVHNSEIDGDEYPKPQIPTRSET